MLIFYVIFSYVRFLCYLMMSITLCRIFMLLLHVSSTMPFRRDCFMSYTDVVLVMSNIYVITSCYMYYVVSS